MPATTGTFSANGTGVLSPDFRPPGSIIAPEDFTPATATVKEILIQLMNLNVEWEDLRLQLVENDNGTFTITHEAIAGMFDDLLHARADPGSGPKPRTKHEMREAGEGDDVPLNFERGVGAASAPKAKGSSRTRSVQMQRGGLLWQQQQKRTPKAMELGVQMMDEALERAASRRSSTINWPDDWHRWSRFRGSKARTLLRSNCRKMVFSLLQCHWMIRCSETICMIVCARP